MLPRHQTNHLLHILNALLCRISALDLNQRIASYRGNTSAGDDSLIEKHLDKTIHKLAQEKSHQQTLAEPLCQPAESVSHEIKSQTVVRKTPVGKKQAHNNQAHKGRVYKVVSDFSNYFKRKRGQIDSSPYLSDKLIRSTWTHIHTALRQARQGDLPMARLHAEIARQAMKQAGQYMAAQEHQVFADEIKKALENIQ